MAHRASGELATQAQFTGLDVIFTGVVKAVERGIAAGAGQGQPRQHIVFLAAAHTQSGPARPLLAEVQLTTHRAKQIPAVGIRPGLAKVAVRIRRLGNGQRSGRRQRRAWRCHVVLLPAQVGRQPRAAAAPVQPQRSHAGAHVFAIHPGFTAAARQIQAHAGCIVRPKTARNICCRIGLAAAGTAHRDTAERLIAGAFGHHIDQPAQATTADAARPRTTQEGIGTPEHFHALDKLGRHVLPWHQAIQTVVGDVIGVQRETPDKVGLLKVAKTTRLAHAGVVEQHIAHALGLLVLNQRAGVAGGGKWHVHHVLRTQHAQARAPCHLPPGVGLGQPFGRSIGAGLYGHGFQRSAGLTLRPRASTSGPKQQSDRNRSQRGSRILHDY